MPLAIENAAVELIDRLPLIPSGLIIDHQMKPHPSSVSVGRRLRLAAARPLHPYIVPCFLTLPIEGGNEDYFAWARERTLPK